MNENYCQALVYCAIWLAETPAFVIETHVGFFIFALVCKCYFKFCIRISKFE